MTGSRAARLALTAGLLAWFLLPLVPLVVWSMADQWAFPARLPQRWGTSGWSQAVASGAVPAFGRSVLLGSLVAALATPAGALAARALALGLVRRPRVVGALLLAPVALPPFAVVLGVNVLLLQARVPPLAGVVLVLVVAALPYTTYTLRVAYAGYDVSYEDEARLLGAGPGVVRWRVRLPLLAPAFAAAAFLAFLVGWSDYIVTVLIGGGRLVTYPLLIASAASGVGNEPAVAVLALTSLLPPLVLLVTLTALGRGRHRQRASTTSAATRQAGREPVSTP